MACLSSLVSMIAVAVLASSSTAPSNVVDETRVSSLFVASFSATDVGADTVTILERLVTAELARSPRVEVLSSRELRTMLDDAAGESGGCDEGSACLNEVAAALGARHLVVGDATLAGGLLALELALLDLESGDVVAREVVRGRDLPELHDRLPASTQNLLAPLTGGARVVVAEPMPFRRFDDGDSLAAMAVVGAVSGGTAALLSVLGFASLGGVALLLTTDEVTLQAVALYGMLAAFAAVPFATGLVALTSSLGVDAVLGGDHVVSRALLVGALTVPLAMPLGGVLLVLFLGGQPIGWSIGMALEAFDNDDLNQRFQALYLGGAVVGAVGSLVVVGLLAAATTGGLYALSIWLMETVEPEGEIVVERARAPWRERLAQRMAPSADLVE